ncbi:uncharacterized protein BYT42DRAFT_99234 [Radiomyces spectabilis]|uniref:uncharacterized protein n=1 Tax=Radiomyces spectabilis TaxID=64574 RepID=UPI002220C188|nr:uncharacterized protein BYT42DRAFT_99234 [Radiomyces spectabilis]KAI8370691.1 hypothetical protein BYT42DRAFT_99234 [Radiomyces spectabilis]
MFLKQGLTAVALLTFVLVKTSEGARACLATAVNNEDSNTKYTFALASLDDGDTETRIQEACYYGCGGQLMTKSPDRDSNGLTILDNSIHFLVSSGFLSSNETYIVVSYEFIQHCTERVTDTMAEITPRCRINWEWMMMKKAQVSAAYNFQSTLGVK